MAASQGRPGCRPFHFRDPSLPTALIQAPPLFEHRLTNTCSCSPDACGLRNARKPKRPDWC
jgi:hypothetical protein